MLLQLTSAKAHNLFRYTKTELSRLNADELTDVLSDVWDICFDTARQRVHASVACAMKDVMTTQREYYLRQRKLERTAVKNRKY